MTMPAIAPPLNPLPPLLEEAAPPVGEEVDVTVAVAVEEKTSAMDEKTGSVTS